jgi:hypothetical protein
MPAAVIVWIASVITSVLISKNRGNSTLANLGWLIVGILLGPIGALVAAFRAGRSVVCECCLKGVHPDATK